jgi:HPt (histidine-containing phosphotransfer) domain-containing protein
VSIETASVPAIDMRAITQLAESDELGEQFVAEIIDVFLTDLSERVRAIGLQMSHDDRGGIAATAHAVKGSCDSMVAETARVRAALEAYRSSQMRGPER